ncbi:MAG: hypothetical protein ATN36_04725 [Epulopiscium sp. Nele67-Bin005]|nr:MAG: hypothetical protein ATN36_04725 [Epulopiscium sp. Nele67-Bin005]
MDKLTRNFTIGFKDVNSSQHLKMEALIDFTQEMTREHSRLQKIAFTATHEKFYWIMVRNKVNLDYTPKVDDTLTIDTFVAGIDKLFIIRKFEIFNEQKDFIGDITTYYFLMDKQTHRPIKLKNSSGIFDFDVFDYEGETLPKLSPKPQTTVKSTSRNVYSSEIDMNQHMNNKYHIRWTTDMYNTTELAKKPIKSIHIQYTKQLVEGDSLDIVRIIATDENEYVIGQTEKDVYFISKVLRTNI